MNEPHQTAAEAIRDRQARLRSARFGVQGLKLEHQPASPFAAPAPKMGARKGYEEIQQLVQRVENGMTPTPQEIGAMKTIDARGADLSGLNLKILPNALLQKMNLRGATFPKDMTGADLHGLQLEGVRAAGTKFDRANLSGANLDSAKLDFASFIGTNAGGAKITRASAKQVTIVNANFGGASIAGSNLGGSRICDSNFDNAGGRDANLNGVTMRNTRMVGAQLQNAQMSGSFRGVNFSGADMGGAQMKFGDFGGATFAKTNITGMNTYGAKIDAGAMADSVNNRDLDIKLPTPSFGHRTTFAQRYNELKAEGMAVYETAANDETVNVGRPTARKLAHAFPTPSPMAA